ANAVEDDGVDNVDGGEEGEEGLQGEEEEVCDLEEGGRVEGVDAEEGKGGAGEEDAELVDCLFVRISSDFHCGFRVWDERSWWRRETYGVGWVEGTIVAEGG
ncbi:MAG: hypothetical protein LQ352_007496, partial [Teloschistes flavicans]